MDDLGVVSRRGTWAAALAAAARSGRVGRHGVLVGIGTFFAQAAATGFVGKAATADRGSASGIYLACYFFGGMVGTAVLGQLFDRFGWPAAVTGIALAMAAASLFAVRIDEAKIKAG
jgi:hypothetical protein